MFLYGSKRLITKLRENMTSTRPNIRKHLLWEYDWETFDFSRMATVVIERVIERGRPEEWQEIVDFYGADKVLETTEHSPRLDAKHKHFTRVYLKSGFIHVTQKPDSHTP